jgi:hypothetical protein
MGMLDLNYRVIHMESDFLGKLVKWRFILHF